MSDTKPQMGTLNIAFIKKFLLRRAENQTPLRILEWGAGGSTVHLSKWLASRDISFTWTALEYDALWYEKVVSEVRDTPETNIVFFQVDGNPRSKEVLMNEYVLYPRTQKETYDLIIVDGRKRRRCILEAKEHLAPGGIVLLHDAWRPRYHCALSAYPTSRFLYKSFWLGSLEVPSSYATLTYTIMNQYFMLRGRLRQVKKSIQARVR